MGETKNEKFRRLARSRAKKVAEELRKIGNLGSFNYEYSEDEVETLFAYIEERMSETRSRFRDYSGRKVPSLDF